MMRTMERVLSGASLAPAGGRLLLLHADAATAQAVMARVAAAHVLLSHRSLATLHEVMRALGVHTEGTPTALHDATVTAFHAHGVPAGVERAPNAPSTRFDGALLRLPADVRSAQLLLLHAARALPPGAHVHLLGATNEGVRSIMARMQHAFDAVHTAAHAGGMHLVIGTHRGEESVHALRRQCAPYDDAAYMLAQQVAVPSKGCAFEAFGRPGVFSCDHPDEATLLLAEQMQLPPDADLLDLGCGSGILGAVALATGRPQSVTLVDADCEAVRCATRTMHEVAIAHRSPTTGDQGVRSHPARSGGMPPWRVLASDVTSAVRGEQFDVVVCNPPFHTGKATDLTLPTRFIREAAAVLREGGVLQLVANRTLPYEQLLEREFGNRRVMHDGRRFKLLEAQVTRVPPPLARATAPRADRPGR